MALNHVGNSDSKAESASKQTLDDFVSYVIVSYENSDGPDITSQESQKRESGAEIANAGSDNISKVDDSREEDNEQAKRTDGTSDQVEGDSKRKGRALNDSKMSKPKRSQRVRDKKTVDDEDPVASKKQIANCKFECKECGKTLSSRRCLTAHLKRIHVVNTDETGSQTISAQASRNMYTCPCCNLKVHTQPSLAEHMTNVHDGAHHFKCNQCDKRFLTPRRMNDHARKVHITSRKHACELCNKAFKDVHALNRHTNCYHNNERRFSCTVCNTQFKMKYSLVAHLKNVHGDGEHQHECDICKKRFMSQINVERHKQCVHFPKIIGKCEFCDKSFRKEAHMVLHIQTAHGTERNFVCELCGAAFKKKQLVTEHVKCVHLNERNFPCPYQVCDKTFKKTSHLKIHVKNIHERHHNDNIAQPMETQHIETKCGNEVGAVISITDHRSVHILPNKNEKHTVGSMSENKKPVILSTNRNTSNITSVDALRVVQSFQSFIYDRENEPGTQYFVIAGDSNTDSEIQVQNGSVDDDKHVQVANEIKTPISNVMVTSMVHSDT